MELSAHLQNDVNNNTRVHKNVAYIIYPGDSFKEQRNATVNRFTNFLKSPTVGNAPSTEPNPSSKVNEGTSDSQEIQNIKSSITETRHEKINRHFFRNN